MPHVPPQHGPVKRRTRFLLVALGFAVVIGFSAGSHAARAASTYQIPAAIASDCSGDVTSSILTWIGSVPNGSTLSFGQGACYRIEGTLQLQGRSGLTLEGNGALFRSFSAPTDQRAIWRLIGSTGMVLRDMTIEGSYSNGGTLDTSLQHAHAVDLRGTNAEIANVTMSDVAGDCVYFGLGYDNTTRSSGSVHDSTCLRTSRNAVSVTAGDNILVQHLTTDRIGFTVFDVEPNSAPGNWGSNSVTFDSNTIGSYYLYAFALVEQAPISNQTFSNNTVGGKGLRIGAVQNNGFRPQNVTITGNSSTVATSAPAMQFVDVDGVTATGNTVPMTSGTMASVSGSCSVNISGNLYPGGSSQATTSPYTGCSTTTTTTATAPSITSFNPTSGAAGTAVTISGSGFTGATAVTFNGAAATFTLNSTSQITATVPSGASSGPISVTTPAGTAKSSTSFSVTSATQTSTAPPSINSFSPGNGAAGATVTISGSGFTGATAVTFNGAAATFTLNSASQITAAVPNGASSGPISVTTPAGTTKSSTSFSVTSAPQTPSTAPPSISSFSPDNGTVGTTVTINGSGFTGATAVTFNGTAASFVVMSDTQIVAIAPAGGASGTLSVTGPGGTTSSGKRFRFSNH